MDLREIKLAQFNRHNILSNVLEPSFFTTASDDEKQPKDDGDMEQSSSLPPSQNANDNVVTNVSDFTSETLGTAQHHNRLTNTTRDQQLNNNINTHKPHKPQQTQTTQQQSAHTSLQAPSNHNDDQFNSSFGSLELQKRAASLCFEDLECQSINSNKHDDEETDVIIPLKDLRDDYNQEQKSTPATSTSISHLPQKTSLTYSVSTNSITSTASSVSTPGAYLMRGSNVTGRAQMGMITPSKQALQQQNQKISCDDNQLLTANMDSDVGAFDSETKNQETKTISRKLLSFAATQRQCHQNRRREERRMWCVGVSIIVLVIVAITVAVVLKKKRRLNQISNNNDMKKLNWTDLFEECSIHGTINQTLIDPTLISTFKAVKQHYMTNEVVIETCSSQHLALWSIALSVVQHENKMNVNHNNESPLPLVESLSDARYVLSVFFFSLGGPQWNKHFNWLSSLNECALSGVLCLSEDEEDDQRVRKVAAVRLRLNNLNGTIPMEFYRLTSIQSLDLEGNNDIKGTISKDIENLSSLTNLNLFETSFSAPLPSELFSLPSLLTMFLSDTTPASSIRMRYFGMSSKVSRLVTTASLLGGSIPTEIGLLTRLTFLDIRGSLRGHIPQELGNLSLMEKIILRSGSLSGSLPDQLFENNKNWKVVEMRGNKLTGTIPTAIGTQQQLRNLDLKNNELSGSIPSEIGRCSQLEHMNLASNRLGGTIPTEIGMMRSLKSLQLNRNEYTGTVPTEMAGLESLELMALPGCQGLSGTISPLYCERRTISLTMNFRFCDFVDRGDALRKSCQRLSCCANF